MTYAFCPLLLELLIHEKLKKLKKHFNNLVTLQLQLESEIFIYIIISLSKPKLRNIYNNKKRLDLHGKYTEGNIQKVDG